MPHQPQPDSDKGELHPVVWSIIIIHLLQHIRCQLSSESELGVVVDEFDGLAAALAVLVRQRGAAALLVAVERRRVGVVRASVRGRARTRSEDLVAPFC